MRKRVDISAEQVELLQQMADYEGHGNINAALGTLIKFGLPLYMSSRCGELTPVLTQIKPTAHPTKESGFNGVTKTPPTPPTPPTQPAFDTVTLAESLGFKYTKDNSSKLVEIALAQRDDYCVKPGFSEVTDESVAALAGFVDSF